MAPLLGSSKFDAFLAGTYTLTANEMAGYNLFRGKAGCNTCHLDGRGSTQTPGTGSNGNPSTTTGTDTSAAADLAPLFILGTITGMISPFGIMSDAGLGQLHTVTASPRLLSRPQPACSSRF